MPSPVRFIAIDLGAESGRVIVATLAGGRIGLEVMHRFANGPIMVVDADGESLRWDLPATFRNITDGLGKAFAKYRDIAGIGVDTWGVDYGLLDDADRLVTLPFNYRDRRTQEPFAQLHADIPEAEMFARTGVRPMAINTLYQLVAHQRRRPQDLERAACLLTIPDLLHFWLSGEKRSEWSIVGSTQLARAGLPEWDIALLARLGLPARLFQPIARPGTVLGRLRPELCARFQLQAAPAIVLPAAHDTASAVAASPGDPAGTAYLSSGTWSLVGRVAAAPQLGAAVLAGGISNEIAAGLGGGGEIRHNVNIMGLWLVQECRRGFARAGREYTYGELADLANAAGPSGLVLDVDDARFLPPGAGDDTMNARIGAWLRERGHGSLAGDGALIRLVLDGLAAAYARSVRALDAGGGRPLEAVHVIGGGAQNRLLCQLTADACRLPVVAGPVEATALGNVLAQAFGLGLVRDAAAARAIVGASVELTTYQPARAAGKAS